MSASDYPGGLDTDVQLGRVTGEDVIVPAHHNNLVDAIEAIEGAVGVMPSGWPAPGGVEATVYGAVAGLLAGGGGSSGGAASSWFEFPAATLAIDSGAADVLLTWAAGASSSDVTLPDATHVRVGTAGRWLVGCNFMAAGPWTGEMYAYFEVGGVLVPVGFSAPTSGSYGMVGVVGVLSLAVGDLLDVKTKLTVGAGVQLVGATVWGLRLG